MESLSEAQGGNGRAGSLPFEPGLMAVRPLPQRDGQGTHLLCLVLSEIVNLVRMLSPTDRAILGAVVRSGSYAAAARALAPGRPHYRKYVQRRVERFRALTVHILRGTAFGQAVRAAVLSLASKEFGDPR
jgi:hypothetical protein